VTPLFSRRELLGILAATAAHAGLTPCATATAGPTPRGTESPSVAQGVSAAITIAGRPAEIVITPVSPLTTRVTVLALEAGRPQTMADVGVLVPRTWPEPAARIRTLPREQTIRSGGLSVRVSQSADAYTLEMTADGRVVQRIVIDAASGACSFVIGGGPLLGLGQGGPQFDRRHTTIGARSGQGAYQLRTHGGRVPVQWLVDTSGSALFVHQPMGTFDLTGASGRFSGSDGAPALPLDLFIVGAREPAAMMAEYARLTGYPELPPLWSLGYQQSHRTLASRAEVLQEAKTFREKKLPCDTLIYLGTGFCPSGWNTDNGEFTFNQNVFPDPKAMIDQLHDDHFNVVLHIVLEGKTLSGTVADRCTAPPLPTGRTADGHWPDDRQTSCYWPAHAPLFDVGVDGWWPDQGDGLDAPSRLARNRMYWDGSLAVRPNRRPFVLHRNGQAGMQRYASFLWSGDVYSTWETLKTHVPIAINTGLSGIPYWGTDIGGFVPTKELTGELYVRWFQFAAFCPLFRSHGRTWKLRLPWGWDTGSLEPNELSTYTGGAANPDASELHNAAVEPVCKKYLELRSRLMPYLYSVVHESHGTGLPIVRALWLHYPGDAVAAARGDQYLWGRDILVAPVTEPHATSRGVYLPAGRWYDFWTEEAHEGGREIARAVDLETMPLFVRAGAVLPLGPVRQYVTEPTGEPLTVQIYPGADGAFALYEDDGVSFNHSRGDWMGIEMRWSDRERRLTLRLAAGSRMRPPSARRIRVRIVGTSVTRDVTFSGAPVDVRW
jgi:alpha-glucosidase (family GH31 glycosyl hydrolase)